MPHRVLIVDDQLIPRQLFENTVTGSDRYVLAAALDSAAMADAWCAGGQVDLIIMDVVMDDGPTGLEAAERIKTSYPQVKIIVVTSLPDALFLERARQIGRAAGHVLHRVLCHLSGAGPEWKNRDASPRSHPCLPYQSSRPRTAGYGIRAALICRRSAPAPFRQR
jgi:CheY-like chemotaxis protein